MRAVVLVGGFGTRLRPLTLTAPKQMLPVAGLPMIERVLAHLAMHGIDDVVLSLGYKPDAFTGAYPDDRCAGVHLSYAVDPEPLDTAGAVGFAARRAGIDERFLVVNGDVLTDLDLHALVAFHDGHGAEGTIALTQVEDPSHFGVVPTDDAGRVLAFVEKPPRHEAPTDLINAGFYVLEPQVLDRIPEHGPVNIERETFPAMVADGSLYARADGAYWIDVGTPERYLQASLDLLDGVRAEPLDPALLLPEGLLIDATATVERSVLGRGCRVMAGARVVDSVLHGGVTVGERASVRRSILGPASVIGDDASLDELTVLGDGIHVDAGAVLCGALVPDTDSP
ncbi:MAG: mannose-phosphate guanylyltransferase [Actinomycetota bacterium]|nr:mannose-phosphate guanylyltransferase [Actinomycetota bacterium]